MGGAVPGNLVDHDPEKLHSLPERGERDALRRGSVAGAGPLKREGETRDRLLLLEERHALDGVGHSPHFLESRRYGAPFGQGCKSPAESVHMLPRLGYKEFRVLSHVLTAFS